jgi:hypothetical protein
MPNLLLVPCPRPPAATPRARGSDRWPRSAVRSRRVVAVPRRVGRTGSTAVCRRLVVVGGRSPRSRVPRWDWGRKIHLQHSGHVSHHQIVRSRGCHGGRLNTFGIRNRVVQSMRATEWLLVFSEVRRSTQPGKGGKPVPDRSCFFMKDLERSSSDSAPSARTIHAPPRSWTTRSSWYSRPAPSRHCSARVRRQRHQRVGLVNQRL